MTEQERQAAIRKASSDLVYASYTWAVRLKYLRETSMWFWQWLSGVDPTSDKLTELTTVYRAWLYAEGIRVEQQRLIADTNLTVLNDPCDSGGKIHGISYAKISVSARSFTGCPNPAISKFFSDYRSILVYLSPKSCLVRIGRFWNCSYSSHANYSRLKVSVFRWVTPPVNADYFTV